MSTILTPNLKKSHSMKNNESVDEVGVVLGSPDGRRRGICEEMEKQMFCEGDSLHSLREAIVVQETLKNNFFL